jgi:polysaccharide biosynthesis transport protein
MSTGNPKFELDIAGTPTPRQAGPVAPGTPVFDKTVVSYWHSQNEVTEQFRTLRTNLLALSPEVPTQVLTITSAGCQEGKSTASLNLGVVLAEEGNCRVLMVDADMRRPTLAKRLGLPLCPGLSDVLRGQKTIDEVLVQTPVPQLDVMTAGTRTVNPTKLLLSPECQTMLTELRRRYDHVLVDCPPVISMTDAAALGARTDGVLFVIKMGKTSRRVVARALKLLEAAKVRVVGCALVDMKYYIPNFIYRYMGTPTYKYYRDYQTNGRE